MGSMKLPLLKAVEGEATQCTPDVDHRPSIGGTYAYQGVYSEGIWLWKPQWLSPTGEHGSHMGT